MRIIYIAPRYYPHIGGVEYVVKSVAERLVKMGYSVTVIAGEPSIGKSREEEVNGVEVIRWPTWSPGDAYHIPRQRNKLEKLLTDLDRAADLIHIHSVHAILTVYSGLLISNHINAKFVITPHYHGSGHTIAREIAWTVWRRYVGKLLEMADVVHVVSSRESSLITRHYPEAKDKVVVIPNGVEEDVMNYKWQGQQSNYMVYAGRIEKYKRLELALQTAKKLGIKLLIIGQGPYRKKLEKYIRNYYRDLAELLEPQLRTKYLELLAGARYAINPSRHEAYSIFTAEALAIGTPAIITKEIAENLNTETQYLNEQLVIALKAPIKTWTETMQLYLKELYQES